MSEIDLLLKDLAEKLFRDICTPETIGEAEASGFPQQIWDAIVEAGLNTAFNPESDHPELLPLGTLAVVVRAAGEHSLPVPLAETLIAQRIAHQVGLDLPEGPLTIATGDLELAQNGSCYTVSGNLRRVPWGRDAASVLAEAKFGGTTAYVRLEGLVPTVRDANLAGEPRDSFKLTDHPLDQSALVIPVKLPANSITDEARLLRSVQMVGAMSTALQQTLRYAGERVQFGRAIACFQAIQHQVAEMATQVASASAASEAAVGAAQNGPAGLEIMAAKIRASEAAGLAARIAHQVHGAMGTTHEHPLHLSTRRLWSWRDEYGSETSLSIQLGKLVIALGGQKLWPLVTTPALVRDAEGTLQ